MPSQVLVVADAPLHLRDGLCQPWVSHTLCEPIAVGDSHLVSCSCGEFLTLVDRIEDLPTRCKVDEIRRTKALAIAKAEHDATEAMRRLRAHVATERRELRRLLSPSAA